MPRVQQAKQQTKAQPVRSRRNDVDVDESHVKQSGPRNLKSTGPAREALDPGEIAVADRPVDEQKLKMLVFMEEELVVMVHETTDPTDDPLPQVTNDGINQFFIRGKEQTVKRKFVEILARAKKTAYTQELSKDAAGNEFYRNIPRTVPRYPFTVLSDPNPEGAAWLKAIRAEA